MGRAGWWQSSLKMLVCVVPTLSCVDPTERQPGAIISGGNPSDGGMVFVLPTSQPSSCIDLDNDGFGMGCAQGPDCDDGDATSTNQCFACRSPATGCPCDDRAAPVPCNLATDTTADSPEGICHLGQRVCRDARWSRCEALRTSSARYIGTVMPCPGQCDPTCRHIVDCIEPTDTLPASSTFVTHGTLPPAVFCPSGTNAGGVRPVCVSRPGGPYVRTTSPLNWIDACGAPGRTVILANGDEEFATVTLPYSFSFWSIPYTSVNVAVNGMLQFTPSPSQWVNTTLPAPTVPNTVFAFWDDLVTRSSGVCVAHIGTAPNRRTVVQWQDAAFYPTAHPMVHLTFQAVLSEQEQTIDVHYQTMQGIDDTSTGASATIGVQEGGGSRFDLVAYNTPGAVTGGTRFRWTPTSNDQFCEHGTFVRRFEATCPVGSVTTIPAWGQLRYTSLVPRGSAIRMEVRAGATLDDVNRAVPIRLPDAPTTTGTTPIAQSYELGDILVAAGPRLGTARFVELRAYFDPGPDDNLAPQLGSVELQYRCRPAESPYRCDPGGQCHTAGICRHGIIACPNPASPVCVDNGAVPIGTPCGPRQVCNAMGQCVACSEGVPCDTGNNCEFGRISCATGAPVCQLAGYRTSGTICAFGSGAYTRTASPFGWINACSTPGADRILQTDTDGTTDVTLPFPFRFYGTVRTQMGVSVNGMVGFPSAVPDWINTPLPATGLPDAILPFWDDLQTRPTGICTAVLGRVPNRLFVTQWDNADLQDRGNAGDLGASLNFEVVLEESNQAVHVIYGNMVGDDRAEGSSATVGIQRGDGTAWNQFSYNDDEVRPFSGLRWMPPISSICNGTGMCEPCLNQELCDGRDNTCNGLVDEGIAELSCGVGACRRTVAGCIHGAPPTCVPGTPTAEVCNGVDDNCNGQIDETCAGAIACPANTTMFAGDTRSFTATRIGMLTSLTWTVLSGPTGGATSLVWNPSPPNQVTESIRPIIVGVYTIRVSGVDGLGVTRACTFNLTANSRGLRVELTWNGAGDVDLHLHDASPTRWFQAPQDCYYENMNATWGARLDVDNVTANGPENIRINTPPVGSVYTIGVHNYANAAGRIATVRVYCGTGGTTPAAVFNSPVLFGSGTGNCSGNTFWKVARVTINATGGCSLVYLNDTSTAGARCMAF